MPNGPEVNGREEQNGNAAGTKNEKKKKLIVHDVTHCAELFGLFVGYNIIEIPVSETEVISKLYVHLFHRTVQMPPVWYVRYESTRLFQVTFIVIASENNLEPFELENLSQVK